MKMVKSLNQYQLRLIAEFFSNMAVVWFAAAFIAPVSQATIIKSLVNGFVALGLGILLLREVAKR